MTNPSPELLLVGAGTEGGVEIDPGLMLLIVNESEIPNTAPPYPLYGEFGESIDARFVLPPQFSRTL